MAAALVALLALLAPVASPVQVSISEPRTVALLFQPVLLRCEYRPAALDPPPMVTWKYKSFCSGAPQGSGGQSAADSSSSSSSSSAADACPDSARTVRIVAVKQGDLVTLGDFYRGREVTVLGGAELSLGPAAWGDSGLYICTVTTTQNLQGNNEAVAELVVLDWLFVLLVLLGALLLGLGLGVCWCQCCPHTCCCLLPCPCCPQRCCCPQHLYFAGKAATSGGVLYGHPPQALPLQPLGSSQSSQVPLLRDSDGSVVTVPSLPPPPPVLRYLEDQIEAFQPRGYYPPASRPGPPPSDISSLHEPPDSWEPPRRGPPRTPPSPSSPPPSLKGRWRSEELLGGTPPTPRPPLSRSRDDLLGGGRGGRGEGLEADPRRPPGPPRRLRKDALSRESLLV